MNFKSDALTARAKRAGVLAEKARIEQKIKDIVKKERMLSTKMDMGNRLTGLKFPVVEEGARHLRSPCYRTRQGTRLHGEVPQLH